MSASVTSANWANVGVSGSWADATKWNPASVPGASNNVLIGTMAANTTVPWTVTVAGAQAANSLTMDMGSHGTLSVTGALNVAGTADLGYGTVAGGTVDLGAGASLTVGGNMVAMDSTFVVNGATVTTGGYADLDGANAALQNNAVWNANSLWIGQFFTTGVTVGAGSRLDAAAQINVGYDGTKTTPFVEGIGSLAAAGGGIVSTPSLDVVNGSVVQVDSLSSIAIGGAPTVAGALAIGSGGTVALEAAKVTANVVDNGILTALLNPNAASLSAGTGPVISGTLSGGGSVHVGTGYTMEVGNAAGFAGSVTIDHGGTLRLDAGGAPTGPISMKEGTLDLRGLAFSGSQALAYAGSMLSVDGTTLDVGTGLSVQDFTTSKDATGGTIIVEVACYAAGTRITAEQGEVAVELLRAGDRVRTASGRIAPVRWVGQTTLDVRRHPHAAPVRIAPGAFAPGLPRRELLVSGDHAIAIGDVLIPARKLVNGATIRQDLSVPAITYVHVELDRHDLLLAEGLAAESFLDTGNRGQFEGNATEPTRFDADPEAEALRIFAERGCAPLVLHGPVVEAAHARLKARAEALGWQLVADAALTIEADGMPAQAAPDGPDALRVVVPPGTRRLLLRSRSFVPAAVDPAIRDGRELGVAVAVELDGTRLDEAAFGSGWYAADPGMPWRWTDGAATLLLPSRSRAAIATVHVVRASARYWVRGETLAQAA